MAPAWKSPLFALAALAAAGWWATLLVSPVPRWAVGVKALAVLPLAALALARRAEAGPLLGVALIVVGLPLCILLVRISCELIVLLVRIHDDLADIKTLLARRRE